MTQIRNIHFGIGYRLDELTICPDNQAPCLLPDTSFLVRLGSEHRGPQRTVNQHTVYLHKVSNRCLPCAYSPRLQMAPDPGFFLLQTFNSHVSMSARRAREEGGKGQAWSLQEPVEAGGTSLVHIRRREPSQRKSLLPLLPG